jgi:hypothetical protein
MPDDDVVPIDLGARRTAIESCRLDIEEPSVSSEWNGQFNDAAWN